MSPEFDVEYRINSRGLRDSETDPSEAQGKRLVLLGDSFAEGWGVEIGQAVSEQLEERLSTGGVPGEVFNFGVAGYGTDQQLLLFERHRRAYAPESSCSCFTETTSGTMPSTGESASRGDSNRDSFSVRPTA